MEKIALITGASRGIGRATARRLAHEGYTVAVNYHVRQDCADSLVAELAAEGLRAAAFQADVADRAQVEDMVRRVEDTFGPVSLLVNNAGVAGQALFQDVTEEMWRRYFGVNIDGAFHTIQAVLPPMLREHAGCIVNVSSMWGLRGASCEVTYSATKAALIALTRSLAAELAPTHPRQLRCARRDKNRHALGAAGRGAAAACRGNAAAPSRTAGGHRRRSFLPRERRRKLRHRTGAHRGRGIYPVINVIQ